MSPSLVWVGENDISAKDDGQADGEDESKETEDVTVEGRSKGS